MIAPTLGGPVGPPDGVHSARPLSHVGKGASIVKNPANAVTTDQPACPREMLV
jgi:hypothetical protein